MLGVCVFLKLAWYISFPFCDFVSFCVFIFRYVFCKKHKLRFCYVYPVWQLRSVYLLIYFYLSLLSYSLYSTYSTPFGGITKSHYIKVWIFKGYWLSLQGRIGKLFLKEPVNILGLQFICSLVQVVNSASMAPKES